MEGKVYTLCKCIEQCFHQSTLVTVCTEAGGTSCEYEVNVNTAPRADLGGGGFSTFHELTQSCCGNSYFQKKEIKFFLPICIVISAEKK